NAKHQFAQVCTFPVFPCEDVMGASQGNNSLSHSLFGIGNGYGRSQCTRYKPVDGGQSVFDPVVQFIDQKLAIGLGTRELGRQAYRKQRPKCQAYDSECGKNSNRTPEFNCEG